MFSISQMFLNQNLSMYLTKHQTTNESHTLSTLKGIQVSVIKAEEPRTCCPQADDISPPRSKAEMFWKKDKVGWA